MRSKAGWMVEIAGLLSRCATHASCRGHVDLHAGEQLCVITPLLKSGGYEVKPVVQAVGGNTVTLSAAELEGGATVPQPRSAL